MNKNLYEKLSPDFLFIARSTNILKVSLEEVKVYVFKKQLATPIKIMSLCLVSPTQSSLIKTKKYFH